MKSAIGLLIATLGGILIYDGFAGRSLWSDVLSVIRGQGLPTSSNRSLTTPTSNVPANTNTGSEQGNIPNANTPSVTTEPNPIGSIGRIVRGSSAI